MFNLKTVLYISCDNSECLCFAAPINAVKYFDPQTGIVILDFYKKHLMYMYSVFVCYLDLMLEYMYMYFHTFD